LIRLSPRAEEKNQLKVKGSNMESLEFLQDATLSNNGIYEVGEAEGPTSGDSNITRLQEDLTTERQLRLRLLAEFDNYRRRTKQEAALAEANGKREVLLALLDLKDDVDRALLHIRETSDAVADGLRLIHQRFNNLLEAHGVTAFESEGQVFDPEIHEAVTMIDGDGEQSGTVYSEHRRGYLMNGKLLRPARVAVLK
jgi:molecular chaperone GrpE